MNYYRIHWNRIFSFKKKLNYSLIKVSTNVYGISFQYTLSVFAHGLLLTTLRLTEWLLDKAYNNLKKWCPQNLNHTLSVLREISCVLKLSSPKMCSLRKKASKIKSFSLEMALLRVVKPDIIALMFVTKVYWL